jgi:hypothetical protein
MIFVIVGCVKSSVIPPAMTLLFRPPPSNIFLLIASLTLRPASRERLMKHSFSVIYRFTYAAQYSVHKVKIFFMLTFNNKNCAMSTVTGAKIPLL